MIFASQEAERYGNADVYYYFLEEVLLWNSEYNP